MTERYIPESAVRELAEEMRANEYAAANDISGEGQAAAKAYQEAADRMALLATAAPQDEAPEPEEGAALALEVRDLASRYAEHLPAGFRASLGLLLSGRGHPAPEPEGMRDAATRATLAMERNVSRHETMWVSEQREHAARLRTALARPAAAEGGA